VFLPFLYFFLYRLVPFVPVLKVGQKTMSGISGVLLSNPKYSYLNPKQIQNSNYQNPKQCFGPGVMPGGRGYQMSAGSQHHVPIRTLHDLA